MNEPGLATARLAVSLRPEDERQLTHLRAHLECKTGKRHSYAKVVRLALDCLSEAEGVQ